jgi:hypothetical protein
VINAVDDSIRSDNYFTDSRNAVFWDDAATLGKVLKLVGLRDEAIGESFGALRTVA